MIDPDRVLAYMHGFYGYGTYAAKYWFIGLEEGGATSGSDLTRRIDVWHTLGGLEIEDLYAFHEALGSVSWFGATAKRQATWARLVRAAIDQQSAARSGFAVAAAWRGVARATFSCGSATACLSLCICRH